jgi:hypothetical protein
MDLSTALKSARRDIEKNATSLSATGEAFLPYWLSELNTEATASQLALAKILLPYAKEAKHLLPALFKGIELELTSIASSAHRASKTFYLGGKSLLDSQLREIDTRVRRHNIKCAYIEDHLGDILSRTELEDLGQGFNDERERLCRSIRLMDEGG